MKKTIKPFFLLCCISGIIYSCTKSNNSGTNNDNDTQSASDNSFAESTNADVANISVQSEDNGVTGSYNDSTYSLLLSPCATISINNISSPHQLIVDFGADNCLCYDGKYRRGKILVSYTGLYRDSASTHTITFDNYYVNNYKVDGTQTVVNNGHNANGNLTFSVQVNSTIANSTGKTLTYTSTRTREWVAGENTAGLFDWTDDVYSITGNASGTDFDGTQFTSNITSPLIVALNCRWIEQGKIEFTPSGKLTRTIDFGNGDCDNKAVVGIAGLSFNILLP
jgi:hypothetical protein